MKCDQCNAIAVVHTTCVVGGQRVVRHTCPEHAPPLDEPIARQVEQARAAGESAFLNDPELAAALRDLEATRKIRTILLAELVGALLDPSAEVRIVAIYHLCSYGADAEAAMEGLVAATRDPDPRVRRAATHAVAWIEKLRRRGSRANPT